MAKTASGSPIAHPSAYVGGAGRSAGSPSGAPALTQRRIVSFWTCVPIDFTQGRASLKVRSDIGAISPGRWHVVQFLYRIGATSLLNVGDGTVAFWAKADPADASM